MPDRLQKTRNIGIIAHIDAGKTTCTERILYYTGTTYKMGDVDDGTTVTDFDQEEQQRGITIYSAAVSCPWRGHNINVIDTPGHVDFTAEVERSVRVLDGAVAVFDAKEGVQAQSETVWRQARKYNVPCLLFINKMDAMGADFDRTIESLKRRLGANPLPLQLPIGHNSTFEGFIDLVTMKAIYFRVSELGAPFEEREIPPDMAEDAEMHHHDLVERAADCCDELMQTYLDNDELSPKQIRRGIRRGVLSGKVHPVLCGSALKYIGVRRLLDAVCDYLPSPLEVPPVVGHDPKHGAVEVRRAPDAKEPFCGLVFKVVADNHGDLSYIRIYSGVLKAGTRVYNSTREKKENVARLVRLQAKQRTQDTEARAGDIVAIIGLKNSATGDTLCDQKHPIVLENIEFPETVISMAIEPRSTADKDRLAEALARLSREDPTLEHHTDRETGQTLLAGMGELHLEVVVKKLMRDMKVAVNTGKPKVSYRETISKSADGEGRFIRQTGGRGQFAVVNLRVEPHEPQEGEHTIEFENQIKGGAIGREYIRAVEQGAVGAARSGVLAGYPMIRLKVILLDGREHEVDSSEMAFEGAGALALRDAVMKAAPQLLEPIMRVQVEGPDEFFGVLAADLNSRRGIITHSDLRNGTRVLEGEAPLAEMFGYATVIRSLTQGRATYTMEPAAYRRAPASVTEAVLATY